MSGVVGTLAVKQPNSAGSKLLTVTGTLAGTTDTITLTQATHGITAIEGIVGATITGGMDAGFSTIQVSYSGLILTVVSLNCNGGPASDFTGTTVEIALVGTL